MSNTTLIWQLFHPYENNYNFKFWLQIKKEFSGHNNIKLF